MPYWYFFCNFKSSFPSYSYCAFWKKHEFPHRIQHLHSHLTVAVSGVHQRGAGWGAPGAWGVLEGEDGLQKLHHERPVGASAVEEEKHAVGAAAEQEEREAVEPSRAHLAAETEPLPALRAAGAVRAGQEPHEAPGPPHRGIRWADDGTRDHLRWS